MDGTFSAEAGIDCTPGIRSFVVVPEEAQYIGNIDIFHALYPETRTVKRKKGVLEDACTF